MSHIPVLLQEVLTGLDLKKGQVVVDGTENGGGHSEAILNLFPNEIELIGIDLDKGALERADARLSKISSRFVLKNESFRNIDKVLEELQIVGVDRILLDLGWSSNQIEESGRGFSFQKNEPLLMTFKNEPTESDLTARDIVNFWDAENIATILQSYGEEKHGWKIAQRIVESRKEKSIETTFDLVEIIKLATPKGYQHGRIHPATKTFQALRITVNDEIGALKEVLDKGFKALLPRGRLVVIAFHSLEDRIVKNFAKNKKEQGIANIITKKPLIASRAEIVANPRSRSAKLRIIEKI